MTGVLDGKVAVITGAGSGMGRATATLFAEQGARVVVADISGDEDATAKDIGDTAIAMRVDVADSQAVKGAVDAAVSTWGRLDIMCNVAGILSPPAMIDEYDDEFFDRVVSINLKGTYYGMKHAIPAILAGGGGAIVNWGLAGQCAWCSGRGGLRGVQGWSRHADEGSRGRIRVTWHPGERNPARCGGDGDHPKGPRSRVRSGGDGNPAADPDGSARTGGGGGERGSVPCFRCRLIRHGCACASRRRLPGGMTLFSDLKLRRRIAP